MDSPEEFLFTFTPSTVLHTKRRTSVGVVVFFRVPFLPIVTFIRTFIRLCYYLAVTQFLFLRPIYNYFASNVNL